MNFGLDRRTFLTDQVLGVLLAKINTPTVQVYLLNVQRTGSVINNIDLPTLQYYVTDDTDNWQTETDMAEAKARSQFVIRIDTKGSTDTENLGANRIILNKAISLVRSAINDGSIYLNSAIQIDAVTGEQYCAWRVRTTRVQASPDFGNAAQWAIIQGEVFWNSDYATMFGNFPNAYNFLSLQKGTVVLSKTGMIAEAVVMGLTLQSTSIAGVTYMTNNGNTGTLSWNINAGAGTLTIYSDNKFDINTVSYVVFY